MFRSFLLALLLSLPFLGCKTVTTRGPQRVDTFSLSPVPLPHLSLTRTEDGPSASACPIGATLAWTALHVVDQNPRPTRWEMDDPYGHPNAGGFEVLSRYPARDLALISSTTGAFPHHWTLAQKPPFPGEKVVTLGKIMGNQRVLDRGHVLAIYDGEMLVSGDSMPGSSGGCVLDSSGEVVGVHLGAKFWTRIFGDKGQYLHTISRSRVAPLWEPDPQ